MSPILYIANRGEIARRIQKTAKRLGFKTAVGFSRSDEHLPFVVEADVAISLDGLEAAHTYLDIAKVIKAIQESKATAVHPGYGFLSENSEFANAVRAIGVQFIGAHSSAMKMLGDKVEARKLQSSIGFSLLPSYDGDDQSLEAFQKAAAKMQYPILLKPVAGGGGKGMTIVSHESQLAEAFASAKRIAKNAFGDDRIYFERFLDRARHIEVQVLADQSGQVWILGERECTLQRRHQKIIEEAPCLDLTDSLRAKIYDWSKSLIQKAKYHTLATVEWIWDGADDIYFLEVNTRLQVEHPVTEMVTGLDLVEWQIKSALEPRLVLPDFQTRGHAIEARLCAEDPANKFMPSGGMIYRLEIPDHVRIDLGYGAGQIISSYFDSLIGKWIVHASNRDEACALLIQALQQTIFFGPQTNRSYLIQILKSHEFKNRTFFTRYLDTLAVKERPALSHHGLDDDELDWFSPWGAIAQSKVHVSEVYESRRYHYTPDFDWSEAPHAARVARQSMSRSVQITKDIRSPLPGRLTQLVYQGQVAVKKDELLFVVEAMKMEHRIVAPKDGTLKVATLALGQSVNFDQVLAEFE